MKCSSLCCVIYNIMKITYGITKTFLQKSSNEVYNENSATSLHSWISLSPNLDEWRKKKYLGTIQRPKPKEKPKEDPYLATYQTMFFFFPCELRNYFVPAESLEIELKQCIYKWFCPWYLSWKMLCNLYLNSFCIGLFH